jgi:HlyD family secretion protein
MPLPALAFASLSILFLSCQGEGDPNQVEAHGYVEATEVRVATKIGGTLQRLVVDVGDELSRGQEIARIDTVDLELQQQALEAEHDIADARLRLMQAGFRREDIEAASAQVSLAEVELVSAQRDLDRFQRLLDKGSGTEKNRDDALTRRDAAQNKLKAAQENLARLQRGFRPEEIDEAAARVQATEARMSQIQQQIQDATITSPRGGMVTEKLVEEGEIVSPGMVLTVVTDLQDIWLTAFVGGRDLGRLKLGQEARVVTDDGQERTGTLTWISPRSEFTPKNVQTRDERERLVYEVRITLPNEDGLFKTGMPGAALLAVH